VAVAAAAEEEKENRDEKEEKEQEKGEEERGERGERGGTIAEDEAHARLKVLGLELEAECHARTIACP